MRRGVSILTLAMAAALGAVPAHAGSFSAAVAKVLMGQKDGKIAELAPAQKKKLIACANGVLSKLPAGKQRYVAEAKDYGTMEDRFGEVVMENNAEWKKKIARACGELAT